MMNNTPAPEKELTGYPSIDKPWLKYYSEEAINAPLSECTIYEYLWENNKDHLEDVALIYFGAKIKYRELFKNIDMVAKAFSAIGVKEADIVTLLVANTPETIYMLYALNKLGAIANMIDPRTSVDGLKEYFSEAGSEVVVTVDLAYSHILLATSQTTVKTIIVCSVKESMPCFIKMAYSLKNKNLILNANSIFYNDFIKQGLNCKPKFPNYKKNTCCVIAHTGGTTGFPKGVMLSNDNINSVAFGYGHLSIPHQRKAKYFNDLPPFIMYGLCLGTHTTLCFGFQLIIYPVFDSVDFPRQFVKYKPQHFSDLPDHLYYLSTSKYTKNIDMSFLFSPGVGGDQLNEELEISVNNFLKEHGCKYEVLKGYGMTELASTDVVSTPEANAVGSIGIPLVINTIKIMDTDTMQELKCDQVGEIWINGPSIMMSYFNNAKETDKLISTDSEGKRWVRTGDLGYITEDGLLYHKGRIRRIYLTTFNGQPAKIFPMVVEDAIAHTAGVRDCSVVGRKRQNSDYYELVAFVVKADEVDENNLVKSMGENCAKKVPSYMIPTEYRVIDSIPRTPTGKVDFIALEEMVASQDKGE